MKTPMCIAALFLLASCGKPPAEPEHVEAHGHEDAPHAAAAEGGDLVVPLEGLRGIRVEAAPTPREEGAWYPGEAIADEAGSAVLSSPVAGTVASAPEAPGHPVHRGAHLLVIDSPESSELSAHLSVAQADAQRAHAALDREERLLAAGATSRREYEDASREAAVADAGVAAAHAALATRGLAEAGAPGRVTVIAPADGAVVRWTVRRGQGVSAGAELGLFQSASARLVRVDLAPPGPRWVLGDTTDVRASDGRRWTARISGVPSLLSEDTRRLAYRLELTQGALPLPGQPVEVRVPYAAAVILPQAAVQQIEGTWGVFVKTGEAAAFRPVKRGVELGSDVVIAEGVAPGDEIVTEGAYLLKSLWLKGRSGGDDHDH